VPRTSGLRSPKRPLASSSSSLSSPSVHHCAHICFCRCRMPSPYVTRHSVCAQFDACGVLRHAHYRPPFPHALYHMYSSLLSSSSRIYVTHTALACCWPTRRMHMSKKHVHRRVGAACECAFARVCVMLRSWCVCTFMLCCCEALFGVLCCVVVVCPAPPPRCFSLCVAHCWCFHRPSRRALDLLYGC